MTFQVSEAEAQSGERLFIKEGMAVVDRSSEGVEPWLWFIDRVGFNIDDGMVEIECMEWRALLERRIVPLDTTESQRAAFRSAAQILAASGGRNPTHIWPEFTAMGGMQFILPDTPRPLGGLNLRQAFDQLALETETEWWLDYHVDWNRVVPRLHWGTDRGRDRSFYVARDEGKHLITGTYSRDGGRQASLVQFVGGGGLPGTRPAGAKAVGSSVLVQRQTAGGRVEQSSEEQRRRKLRDASPATNAELISVSPSTTDERALLQSSSQALKLPISALEGAELSVNAILPWSAISLGDTITVRFASVQLRQGVDLPARVIALQPDEASGELLLVVEVQR